MIPTALAETARRVVSTRMPTRWGEFQALAFEREIASGTRQVETALALVLGDLTAGAPLVRIHSQCLTGDVFHSLRCDCRAQLEIALTMIGEEGRGLLIYEHQEGRGIGLMNKLRAYELQDQGADTVEANEKLGFKADLRSYDIPGAILNALGVTQGRLMSNNPEKIAAVERAGVRVVERVPIQVEPTATTEDYLRTKREKMGHLL